MTASPAAIREQLERMLASGAFATAGRHSRLLRYLVERTLAGDGDQLKEYVLGTEVFDRADSYDPRVDSIVRVEVRRLRSRLEDYYRAAGAADSVIITIPRGSYAPVFALRQPDDAQITAPAIVAPDRRSYSPVAIIAAALSVAIVVFAAGLAVDGDRAPAQASSGPDIVVLPFEHYSTDEQHAIWAAHLTDAVTAELARLSTVSVASRTAVEHYRREQPPESNVAKALNADFLIEASAVATGDHLRVVTRLVDSRLNRKVWVGEYQAQPADIPKLARQIAAEAATAAVARR